MVFKLPKLLSSYTDWLEKQQGSILSAATIITVANIVSSLSGLLRTRFLVNVFYDSPASRQAFEAFQVASQLPDLTFQLLVMGVVSASFIPIFTSFKKQSEKEAFDMTSSMMNLVTITFLIVATIMFIFAEQLTRLRTGAAFTPEQLQIATTLTRVMLAAQLFFVISNFLTGILQSYQRFVLPALAPIFYNLGILLGVYLFSHSLGIYSTGVGVALGAGLHMAIQIPTAIRLGFRFKAYISLQHSGLRTMLKLTPPRMMTIGIHQFEQLAVGYFATTIGNLSFSVLNFASQLMTGPIRFFGVPISQAALPFFAEEADKKDLSNFRALVVKSLHQISFFALPASVLLLILRVPFVRLAIGTPNFPWLMTLTTAKVVAITALSISAQANTQLLIRAFYALKNTRIPFFTTLAVEVVFVVCCWLSVFVFQIGVLGIAIATSVTGFLEMFLLLFFLNRRVPGFLGKALWWPQVKMITASFLMAVFLYLPFRILDELVFNTSRTIELILLTLTTGTIGTLVYIYFAALFDIRELYMIQTIIAKFGSWKKTLARSQEVLIETASGQSEEVA